MATERILLPAPVWHPPDGSAGNLTGLYDFFQFSGDGPDPRQPRWSFAHDVISGIETEFQLPDSYASGGTLLFNWYGAELDDSVTWSFQVAKHPVGSSAIAQAYGSAVTLVTNAHASTANATVAESKVLDMNSALKNQQINILVERLVAGADLAFFRGGVFEYET